MSGIADWTSGAEALAYERCGACGTIRYFRRAFCAVCGSPVGGLLTGLPGTEGKKCSVCHEKVCPKHFSDGKDICSNCDQSSWCQTPKGPTI